MLAQEGAGVVARGLRRVDDLLMEPGPLRGDTRPDTRLDGSSRASPLDTFRRLAQGVGRFQVFEEIARGASGAVYRALDPVQGRAVALKLQLADSPRQAQRLMREAQVLARLEHPHVVRVFDVGQVQGHVWLALELVEGRTLEERVRAEGPLPARIAADLIRRLALGLQHAHEQAVLHRDVKPSNVILDPRGEPRLVDFGLALDLEAHTRLSVEGAALGTPGFWAPELAAGQLTRLGPTTDVYGLGATLYWALTGRAPLGGATLAEIVNRTLRGEVEPPSRHAPEVPPELDAIVLRCLAREPGERWPTARELAQALARWLAIGGEARTARSPARRELRPLLALILVALGGAAAMGIVAVRMAPPPTATPTVARPPSPAPPAPAPPPPATPPPASSPPDQARELFQRAWTLVEADRIDEALPLLDQALAFDPTLADAHNSRGICRSRRGDEAGAEEDFRACVGLDPRHAKGWTNLGVTLRRRGDPAQALDCYQRAIDADPAYSRSWQNRGWLRFVQGDLPAARADLDQALRLDPELRPALFTRAQVRDAAGDVPGALADYEACLAREPDPETLRLRGWLHQRQGDLALALADYDQALRLAAEGPDEVRSQLLVMRAAAREQGGDLPGSLSDLEASLPLIQGRPELLDEVRTARDRLRAHLGR